MANVSYIINFDEKACREIWSGKFKGNWQGPINIIIINCIIIRKKVFIKNSIFQASLLRCQFSCKILRKNNKQHWVISQNKKKIEIAGSSLLI